MGLPLRCQRSLQRRVHQRPHPRSLGSVRSLPCRHRNRDTANRRAHRTTWYPQGYRPRASRPFHRRSGRKRYIPSVPFYLPVTIFDGGDFCRFQALGHGSIGLCPDLDLHPCLTEFVRYSRPCHSSTDWTATVEQALTANLQKPSDAACLVRPSAGRQYARLPAFRL